MWSKTVLKHTVFLLVRAKGKQWYGQYGEERYVVSMMNLALLLLADIEAPQMYQVLAEESGMRVCEVRQSVGQEVRNTAVFTPSGVEVTSPMGSSYRVDGWSVKPERTEVFLTESGIRVSRELWTWSDTRLTKIVEANPPGRLAETVRTFQYGEVGRPIGSTMTSDGQVLGEIKVVYGGGDLVESWSQRGPDERHVDGSAVYLAGRLSSLILVSPNTMRHETQLLHYDEDGHLVRVVVGDGNEEVVYDLVRCS